VPVLPALAVPALALAVPALALVPVLEPQLELAPQVALVFQPSCSLL
jgi:hypothetical protein